MNQDKAATHIARKRFGQNFLQDHDIIFKMVEDLHLNEEDIVLEIGPGLGALTLPLIAQHKKLSVVEIDRDLAAYWRSFAAINNVPRKAHLEVYEVDALKFDFEKFATRDVQKDAICNTKIRVVGNLPYNISSPLLFKLQDAIDVVQDQHFMLQKEVVDRMVARPGSTAFGRLSVMLQATYAMQCLQIVPPESFEPAPKVWSAVVRMVPLTHCLVSQQLWPTFAKIVALAFSQRRKMLRGVLKSYLKELKLAQIEPTLRAEDVSVEQFAALAQYIYARENAK